MKKIFFLVILLSFLTIGLGALAQDNNLPSPGITPDSSFYFLKTWKESIQTFFTFGEESKANQYLHLAEVRLAEYQKMIEKGKTEIAQKTLDKYQEQLNRALEKTEQAKEKGKDVEKLKEAISEKILKHQEVLESVLEKVPEEAKEGIKKAIEASQKGFEKAIEAVSGEKKEELEKKAKEVKSRLEEKMGTVCVQVITSAIGPGNVCQEFPTPCDVPTGWSKIDKCPSVSTSSTPSASLKPSVPSTPSISSVPPKPSTSSEPIPTEIRYYTCPDGTKVESGKCYGTGERFTCSIVSSPELKCSAPNPPVTKGGECTTAGERVYYACSNSAQVDWCICGPESGAVGAKNVWRCQYLPELACPKATVTPTSTQTQDYIKCASGGTKGHQCSSGATVSWQCECLNIVPQATAYWAWKCVLEPAKSCPVSGISSQLAISQIEIRHYGVSIQIFWGTNIPTISYMEYGLTTSYGSRAGGLTGTVGSLDTPGTQFVVEGQHLSIGSDVNAKLRPDATYHFRIVADDTKGNTFVSQDYTFTTGYSWPTGYSLPK